MKKLILINVCLLFAFSSVSLANYTVAPGWDLFETQPGTWFMGDAFEGVPLGNFDFGGTIGPQFVGNTDTIVERLGPAEVVAPGETDTIDIEIVALQLVSIAPINLGAGLDFHYVTLQSDRGGTSSTGQMDIKFDNQNGGTFESFFEVFFDIRIGDLFGPVIHSDSLPMTSFDNPWGRIAPLGAVVIDGVNHLLEINGTGQDFWPGTLPNGTNAGPVEHDASGAAHHVVDNPEPATICLLGLGGLLLHRRKK